MVTLRWREVDLERGVLSVRQTVGAPKGKPKIIPPKSKSSRREGPVPTAAGATIAAVSRRVGHARTSITMDICAHVMPQQHMEVVDKIGAVLFGHQTAGQR